MTIDTENLYKIIEKTTTVYRKGEPVEKRKVGSIQVTEIYRYRHTSEALTGDDFDKVDMIFVDVMVDKKKAETCREDLAKILRNYPRPERLAGGPSYIELAPNLEMEQEGALRLMALGKTLGLWKIVSGKTFGMDDATTREMAGQGLLMISGYGPKRNSS
jgi:hypothetical protein